MNNYVYLIKYNGEVIAVAKNDEFATNAIYTFMKHNKDMKIELFEKEPMRWFGNEIENCKSCDLTEYTRRTINW